MEQIIPNFGQKDNKSISKSLKQIEYLHSSFQELKEKAEGLCVQYKILEVIALEDQRKQSEKLIQQTSYLQKLTVDDIWETYRPVFMEGYTGDKSDFDQQSTNLLLELKLKAKDEQIKELNKKVALLFELVS